MTRLWLDEAMNAGSDFVPISAGGIFPRLADRMARAIDRRLGYAGGNRFVYFYYEPRAEEVMWNDGESYGFGFGGWLTFGDHIAPLADEHGLDLSSGKHAQHALVVDRTEGRAFFADREDAEAIVAHQHKPLEEHPGERGHKDYRRC